MLSAWIVESPVPRQFAKQSELINNMHLIFDMLMVLPDEVHCLKQIALLGGCRSQVFASSARLGTEIATSPQTASRRLQALERQQLITRSLRPEGQYISVTPKGEEVLLREFTEYGKIFGHGAVNMVLSGELVSGLGEGRYYMGLAQYRMQFLEKLGFEPFPGTLNIKLDQASTAARKRLLSCRWIPIQGFVANERTYGDARCLPCRIDSYPCGIVVPGRTHYPEDIVEVIAPVELRTTLGLKDHDMVRIEVPPC